MTLPNDLLDELNVISKTRSFRVFREEALRILKEHGFKHYSNGGFSDVYRKKGLRYVIKITREFDAKFHRIEEYKEGYLAPVYVTGNRFLAIQPVAQVYESEHSKLYKLNQQIMDLEEKLKVVRSKRIDEKKKVARAMRKYDYTKVDRWNHISDINESNVGIYRGKLYMVDLNNHVPSPYYGD